MCSTPKGSGGLVSKLEEFPGAPPPLTVANIAPEDVIDAGLRSLDHCKFGKTQACIWSLNCAFFNSFRQAQTVTMAIQLATGTFAPD